MRRSATHAGAVAQRRHGQWRAGGLQQLCTPIVAHPSPPAALWPPVRCCSAPVGELSAATVRGELPGAARLHQRVINAQQQPNMTSPGLQALQLEAYSAVCRAFYAQQSLQWVSGFRACFRCP